MPSRIIVALGTLLTLGCNGPAGLLPGGSLDGDPRPTPTDWSFAGDAGTMQLETNPAKPYSVNLAYTVMQGRLYVNAGGTETQWVQHITNDAHVRLRLDGGLYDLRAVRVTDRDEIVAFAQAWTDQSFFRRDPLGYDEVWIYELQER